jgi:predicted transcriptional regulator
MTEFEYKFINLIKDKKITKKRVAECLGITQPTLKARLNDPKTFKLYEIETLKQELKINLLEL